MDLNDSSAASSPSINPAGAFSGDTMAAPEARLRVNGESNGRLDDHAFGMHELLHALQAMRVGDFSVRLPSDQTGLEGKP